MTLQRNRHYAMTIGTTPYIFRYVGYSKYFGYHFYQQGDTASIFLGINRLKTAKPQLIK